VWQDVISNEGAVVFVNFYLQRGYEPQAIADMLLDFCLDQGSKDNMSAILVLLPGARKPDPTLLVRRKPLDHTVVHGIMHLGILPACRNMVCIGWALCFQRPKNLAEAEAAEFKKQEGGGGSRWGGAERQRKGWGFVRVCWESLTRRDAVGCTGQALAKALAAAPRASSDMSVGPPPTAPAAVRPGKRSACVRSGGREGRPLFVCFCFLRTSLFWTRTLGRGSEGVGCFMLVAVCMNYC
jgi:hypothetical protein